MRGLLFLRFFCAYCLKNVRTGIAYTATLTIKCVEKGVYRLFSRLAVDFECGFRHIA